MSIIHRPLAGSFYKALALTATVHAVLAGLLVASSLGLAAGQMVTRPAKNTRPVMLAQMPPHYIPVIQRPHMHSG